jgi:D-alanyl-lipoteichoic acid acyltransferase DltB (MBOAT superfamily)
MYFIPKYILILGITIVVDYLAGLLIEGAEGRRRKLFLGWSLAANIGVLALYKYFNFFNENLSALADFLGWGYPIQNLSLILPVGLSFHTFQAMSYTIEVYRGHQKAERHFGIYALYVMFYPQLVAGPIERPQNLLHQFHETHYFDYQRVVSGLRLMAWGLFKKVVVADRLALFVNKVYLDPSRTEGPVLMLGTMFFAFQIFCDFSGYSDIAIGSARVMGFKLMRNFDSPYQAKSISEFWRRWHISLSTWFKDYLYIPLGGNRVSALRWYANMMIVFLVSGLWHGANWTYVIWGGLHGFFLVFGAATQKMRDQACQAIGLSRLPRLHTSLKILTTFLLVCVSWIFFRAPTLHDALGVCSHMFSGWAGVLKPSTFAAMFHGFGLPASLIGLAGMILVEAVQILQRRTAIQPLIDALPWWGRWSLYYAGAAALFFLFGDGGDQFIYFQF